MELLGRETIGVRFHIAEIRPVRAKNDALVRSASAIHVRRDKAALFPSARSGRM
jgi:hypothetical protein